MLYSLEDDGKNNKRFFKVCKLGHVIYCTSLSNESIMCLLITFGPMLQYLGH